MMERRKNRINNFCHLFYNREYFSLPIVFLLIMTKDPTYY